MSKGQNPNRPPDSQANHDKMVRYVAKDLVAKGYNVLADGINWPKGTPPEINGYIPDITATKNNLLLIFEVETCPTYDNDHTRAQLSAFSRRSTTYIIVPPVCVNNGKEYDPVPDVKECLIKWGLTSVRIGTCNPHTGKIQYDL